MSCFFRPLFRKNLARDDEFAFLLGVNNDFKLSAEATRRHQLLDV
jgi:hypothetical protein